MPKPFEIITTSNHYELRRYNSDHTYGQVMLKTLTPHDINAAAVWLERVAHA